MYVQEVIIKILGKVILEHPEINQHIIRMILEEELHNYELKPLEKALVSMNDLRDRAMLYPQAKRVDGLSKTTLYGYALHLSRFAYHMQKNVIDINVMDIRAHLAWYIKTGVKTTTLATEVSILRSFFGWLEDNGYIQKSPLRLIKPPKTDKKLRKSLSMEEVEKLRDSCITLRERAILEFFYSTGCRLDELVKLNKDDINWQTLTVNVFGKGSKERPVYIGPSAKLHLQKYLESRKDDCEALYVTERQPHSRVGRRAVEREIAKIGKRAGLNKAIFPHLIRHSTATHLFDKGAKLTTVQRLLGHTNPATTEVYTDISDNHVEYEIRKCIN
jgi:integrase/recombinase XerD